MYIKDEIKVFFKPIISYLVDKQVYLVDKLEYIFIHLFLTNGEVLELREPDRYKPEIILSGQSVIWEYGSLYEPILEAYKSSIHTEQSKYPVFRMIYKLIRLLLNQVNFYFYLDELYMDGYFEADLTDYTKSSLHPGRRIFFAPNSRILSMCQWLNIHTSYSILDRSHRTNYKNYNAYKLNNNFNSILTKLGLLHIHSEDSDLRMIYNEIPSFIPLFKYPIAYGIRE